jgi:hypothetical protein
VQLFPKAEVKLLARLNKEMKDLLLLDSRYKSEHLQVLPWSYIGSPGFWIQVKKAKRFVRELDRDSLSVIHVFAASRGGSHVFTSQFHFFDVCFAFWGKFYSQLGQRSPWFDHPDSLHYTDFLLRSAFGGHGLQNKLGEQTKVLVYCHNKERRIGSYDSAVASDRSKYREKRFIFYLRNPLRIAHSTYLKLAQTRYSDNDFEAEIRQEASRLRVALELKERFPNLHIFFHEVFCANFSESLAILASFLKPLAGRLPTYQTPADFFSECFPSGDRPVVQDGYLFCSKTREKIAGGGLFNPLMAPNAERTMRPDLKNFISGARLALARDHLKAKALDFWLNDSSATYVGMADQELLDLVK